MLLMLNQHMLSAAKVFVTAADLSISGHFTQLAGAACYLETGSKESPELRQQ